MPNRKIYWRGCHALENLAHIWWDCPKVKKYWKEVLSLIKEHMTIEVPEDPLHGLFHSIKTPINQYKNSLLPHLINAAKCLIPQHWQLKNVTGKLNLDIKWSTSS